MDLSNVDSNSALEEKPVNRPETISKMITKHYEFVRMSKSLTTDQFLLAAAQLCHMDTGLAEQVWLQVFPKFWDILDEQQRNVRVEKRLRTGVTIVDCFRRSHRRYDRSSPPIHI